MKNGSPTVRLLSTGSEILQGLYADTNAQHLSRALLDAGFHVLSHGAVPDDRTLLAEGLERACPGADLVVITGGLGPTEDDLTRFAVAELWQTRLVRDEKALEMMRARFRTRNYTMPAKNAVQADLPQSATPLYNHWGTAPGFLLPPRAGRPALMALPGPPSEMVPMLAAALEGPLDTLFPNRPSRTIHTLHLAMVPESSANEVLHDLIGDHGDGVEVTILASRGHLRLRIVSTATGQAAADEQVRAMRRRILDRLEDGLVTAEGALEQILPAEPLLRVLQERGQTLALAESCTGGGIAAAITDVAGSSATLLAGYVTYANEAKIRDLEVPEELLASRGAVSEAVARAMAEGARRRAGADWSIAVTGVAGPGGGSPEKPVGTVWLAVAGPEQTSAFERFFPGNRESVRHWTVMQALELLRRLVIGVDPDLLAPMKKKPVSH